MSEERIAVRVCRGCCCGTQTHPDTGREGQFAQLERAGLRVLVADCLDVCEHSNAVVDQVAAWIACGGPGLARVPSTLRRLVIERLVRTKV